MLIVVLYPIELKNNEFVSNIVKKITHGQRKDTQEVP